VDAHADNPSDRHAGIRPAAGGQPRPERRAATAASGYDAAVLDSRWSLRVAAPRLPGLLAGLVLFGAGIALMAESGLGLGPWEVFHQGIARLTGLQLGTVGILVGIPVLAAWWPLGERPGLGTVLNVVLIGTSTNVTLGLLPATDDLPARLAMMLAGVGLIGLGSSLYLASDLGPGPRDGLMTGLHLRFGWSIRRARTLVELIVLVLGFLAGGTVGVGTLVFAFGIGPLVQVALGVLDHEGRLARRRRLRLEAEAASGE
jgi:uncharacterized membrane protein YczE